MPAFILNKENGYHQLLMALPVSNRNDFDSKVHKSNLPLRIVNNKYGKIIIACDMNLIYSQIVFANLNLLKKSEHIDFNYLNDFYYKEIDKLIGKTPFLSRKLDYSIVIIAEGKSFEIYDDGYIKEDDVLCSDKYLATYCNGNYPLYEKHDVKFLLDTFETFDAMTHEHSAPLVYVDTKTFKPRILKGVRL